MFKDRLLISREKFEFWYSLVILLVIPLLITANTLLLVTGLRKNFDIELRRKAELVAHVVEAGIYKDLSNESRLAASIERITKERSDVVGITVLKDNGGSLRIVGSTDPAIIGNDTNDIQLTVAVQQDQPVAQLVRNNDNKRIWKVANPIKDDAGKIIGVQTVDVSLQDADALISDLLLRSLVVLAASIVIVILLLFNHFRFVEYAMLFRKLKEVDQLKDDFLSVATHELKAPMTTIKGTIENISDGLLGPVDDKVKNALQSMSKETDRLNNLVNDLLNVSRIEQGRITYDIQPVDIVTLIEPLCTQFNERAKAQGLQLLYEKPSTQLIVAADTGRLTEIMTNLIDNAIKYSKQGTVTILHKADKDTVQTIVRDTGIGIAPQDRERLFNRFYRVKSDATKEISGSGLGLWIIKQYIEHMKGKIYVDSMEGVGSEFIVELPTAHIVPAGTSENNNEQNHKETA